VSCERIFGYRIIRREVKKSFKMEEKVRVEVIENKTFALVYLMSDDYCLYQCYEDGYIISNRIIEQGDPSNN